MRQTPTNTIIGRTMMHRMSASETRFQQDLETADTHGAEKLILAAASFSSPVH
jgi:hypothetical protein